MPRDARAAQFAPFAALTGYDDSIKEAARPVDSAPELTEEAKQGLDRKLAAIAPYLHLRPLVQLTYFLPDGKKQGGSCVTASHRIKRLDSHQKLIITETMSLPVERLLELQCDLFEELEF